MQLSKDIICAFSQVIHLLEATLSGLVGSNSTKPLGREVFLSLICVTLNGVILSVKPTAVACLLSTVMVSNWLSSIEIR